MMEGKPRKVCDRMSVEVTVDGGVLLLTLAAEVSIDVMWLIFVT
jgi:hypothetical protein